MSRVLKVWGPPGTGKSHRLINEAETAITRGVPPSRLGICALTKPAALEIQDRLARQFSLDREDLPWVGTIHSLSFKLLGVNPSMKVEPANLREFFKSPDVNMEYDEKRATDDDEDSAPGETTEGNFCLAYWDWHRANLLPAGDAALEAGLDHYPGDLPDDNRWGALALFKQFIPRYEAWRADVKLWDFTSLLIRALAIAREGVKPDVDVLLVDEAQDLGRLLWAVADEWGADVPRYVLAGDPNQAIYGFLGANPSRFLDHEGEWEYLEKSFRVTSRLVDLAKHVLQDGGHEINFPWIGLGTPEERADLKKACLFRTRKLVTDRAFKCMDQGIPFRGLRGPDPLRPNGSARHVAALLRFGRDGFIPIRVLAEALENVPVIGDAKNRWLKYGSKTDIKRRIGQWRGTVLLGQAAEFGLTDEFIAAIKQGRPWEALTQITRGTLAYYRRLVELHGIDALTDEPALSLSTIHRSKGHEWDQVEVCTDWGRRPFRELNEGDSASEHRVMYVALTRTRGWPSLSGLGGRHSFPLPLSPKSFVEAW